MESGTKTINYGDLIAISFELTTKAGADTLAFTATTSLSDLFPYSTIDTGSGPARQTFYVLGTGIEFDDGTIGWFDNSIPAYMTNIVTFADGSDPDERGILFIPDANYVTDILSLVLSSIGSTDTFDIKIYEDPTGTPNLLQTITYDPTRVGSTSDIALITLKLTSDLNFNVGTEYGITVKATSGNTIGLMQYNFNTGNSHLKKSMTYSNWSLITRNNSTGAFTETDTIVPLIGFYAKEISVESGGSGINSFA
jgi:hypothetical protein